MQKSFEREKLQDAGMPINWNNETRPPYRQINVAIEILAGESIRVAYRPAIEQWKGASPAAHLLANAIQLQPGDRVFQYGIGAGALSVALARRLGDGELWLADSSLIAYELTSRSLQENQVTAQFHWQIDLPTAFTGELDAVVMELPKGRKLAQRWLLNAYRALQGGGKLYLAGSNREGVQSVIRDAESLFGPGTVSGYKKGNRAAVYTKTERLQAAPAWSQTAGIFPGSWQAVEGIILGKPLRLSTLPGVFGYNKFDPASVMLLEAIVIPDRCTVLDLGCGYGLIGSAISPWASRVDMVDVNLYAVASTRHSMQSLGIENARIELADVAAPFKDQDYQIVCTNPPFHTGYGVDYGAALAFIEEAHRVLEAGGELWLVANRFIRYNHLLNHLFSKVEVAVADNRYQVLRARK